MPGASLTPEQKVQIARALARAGVSSIDAGFPACAPSEIEALRRIVDAVEGPVISGLCRALRSDIDAAYQALENADPRKRSITIFVATSPVHRDDKLGKSKGELLDMVADTIEYALPRFPLVAFSPEDASRTELDYLVQVYDVAIAAGAKTIGFTDTLGILTPEKVRHFIRHLQDNVSGIESAYMAVHFHNDLGLAVSNTLAAIEEGVPIVQCAVNGLGERAGNTALEEVAMALLLNEEQYRCTTKIDTTELVGLSELVARLTGVPVSPQKSVVGRNVFATAAGIHQDGILKNPDTYLPFRPETVGAAGIELVLGKHSGRGAIATRLRELGFEPDERQLERVMGALKEATKADWERADDLLSETMSRLFPRQE